MDSTGLKVRDDLKYPLYSAKTFKELRDRFEVIQQMSGNQINNLVEQKQNYAKPAQKGRDGGSELRGVSKQHCFNCGLTSHVRSQCEAETKCFKCNGSGHISKNCDKSNGKRTVSIITNDKRNKRMQINNKYFSCLIDTGADVSLMQQTVYEKHFSNLELSKSSAKLYGLGNVTTTVKGALKAEVLVDKIKSDHAFLVIADSKISCEVIVGYDFIQQFQLEFNSDGYFFSEKIGQKHDGTFQCVYNVVESGHEIDVAPQYREVVMKLINNYAATVQKAINAHVHTTTKFTPYEIMFGVKMRNEMSADIIKLLQDEMLVAFQEDRNKLREEARINIQAAQEVYKRNFDRRRKSSQGYQKADLVAIKVTQFSDKKLGNKFIGPYSVVKDKGNGRYEVEKAADFVGPHLTSTSVDNMKLWAHYTAEDEVSSETDDEQDDRM